MNRFFIATSFFEQMDPGQAQWEVPWSPSLSWNMMLLVFKSMLKIKEATSTHRTTVWKQLSCYSVGSTPWDGHSLNERRAMFKKRQKGQYWKITMWLWFNHVDHISCDQQCGKEWTSLSSRLSQVTIDWISEFLNQTLPVWTSSWCMKLNSQISSAILTIIDDSGSWN